MLLHTKYISCGPNGFREEDFFKVIPIISLSNLDPGGLICRIYVGKF